jgi:DNA-binding FadR family transcriptional regulator
MRAVDELKLLKQKSMTALIQEQIRAHIRASGFKSGDLIPTEAQLSQRMGISKTAIREALKGLESLGIVQAKSGVGRIIKTFNFAPILENLTFSIDIEENLQYFREILELRICLESHFIGKNTDRYTDEDIREMEGMLRELAAQIAEGAAEQELEEAHARLHVKLISRAENFLLGKLIEIFTLLQRQKGYATLDRASFLEVHRAIVDAIRSRDPAKTREVVIEHFSEPLQWLQRQQMEASSPGTLPGSTQ